MTLSINSDPSIIKILSERFANSPLIDLPISWEKVVSRLKASDQLEVLTQMEASGGEPNLIDYEEATGVLTFADCVKEAPKQRTHLCYDESARLARKKYPPKSSAIEQAEAIGAQLLSVKEYRYLQRLAAFDEKTSTWLATPPAIREKGGALFGDRRFDTVFVYHNGADAYYQGRGFRTIVRI